MSPPDSWRQTRAPYPHWGRFCERAETYVSQIQSPRRVLPPPPKGGCHAPHDLFSRFAGDVAALRLNQGQATSRNSPAACQKRKACPLATSCSAFVAATDAK